MACKCPEDIKRRNYYRYYDTPDGCDIEKKVAVASRYGIMAGMLIATHDILMYSHAVGILPMLKRYAYHTIPLGLMGATFATVSNVLLRVRNTDDHLNYFAGGFACSPIVAAYLRSGHGVVAGGLILGVIAMIKKEAIETNFVFFHDFKTGMGHLRQWRNDYTLATDPKDVTLPACSLGRFLRQPRDMEGDVSYFTLVGKIKIMTAKHSL